MIGRQHNEPELSPGKILLVDEIAIGGDHGVKAVALGRGHNFAVGQLRPAHLSGRFNIMPWQKHSESNRDVLIKKDPHAGADCRARDLFFWRRS